MPSKWDDALAGSDAAPAKTTAASNNPSKWDDALAGMGSDALIDANPGFMGDLHNFLKFSGHGTVRGLANAVGMPVDAFNSIGEFLSTYQGVPSAALGPLQGVAEGAKAAIGARGGKPIYTGSGQSARDAANAVGLPTSTPKEEGFPGAAAYWGDVLGEFGGANLPFLAAAPTRAATGELITNAQRIARSDRPLTALLKDTVFGAIGPGTGAGLGGEVAGPEHEDIGKLVGGIGGSTRILPIEAALQGTKRGYSWMHDFLGLGTGADKKVGKALATTAQDLPKAAATLQSPPTLSPGAKVPTDIASGDAGLIALRRQVMATDRMLAGDYRGAQQATADAIKRDAELSPANFNDPLIWLGTKQKVLEETTNRRLQQAVEEAERATETAFQGATPNQFDANVAKHAYAVNLRNQLVHARDDMDAVVKDKWSAVDKEIPVNMDSVYDALNTLKSEHLKRPGQSSKRLPGEVFDRFYEQVEVQKPDGSIVFEGQPRFGVNTKLQDVIDLDSEVGQEIREISAQDAPDRVKMSYLTRLSQALYKAKEQLPDASVNLPLKDALNATKSYHQTFTSGPVGQVLGHDVTSAPDINPGDTIKYFLSRGPGGIDNFDALMNAVNKRTGVSSPIPPTAQMSDQLRNYVRQDFYDAAAPNGEFRQASAQQWLRNNSGPLNHFSDLKKEFEDAVKSQGDLAHKRVSTKQDLDDLRKTQAHLFLNGDPGKLFNGALTGPDQYGATKNLVKLTNEDPTGRATQGLVQMALDHMIASSLIADPTLPELERLSGRAILDWVKDNKGVIKALDQALPKETSQKLSRNARNKLPAGIVPAGTRVASGVKARFDRIAETAHFLEGFRVDPRIPQDHIQQIMPLTMFLAKYMGAGFGSTVASHGSGHSIQMAAVGSKMFTQIAEKLTPEQTAKVLRQAMVDPVFFDLITRDFSKTNPQQTLHLMQPYFYSMGIPLSQPFLTQPSDQSGQGGGDPAAPDGGSGGDYDAEIELGARLAPDGNLYIPDPDREGGYLRVD